MAIQPLHRFLLTFSALYLASCATPIPPGGGPPDRTSPAVTSTTPENETVNFEDNEIRFSFSKFLNRDSFRSSLEIEPDLGIGYEIRFRRRTAIVEFEHDLPENTTVILHLGTELSDTQNNRISSPIQLAVSTGPEIDKGQVTGRVVRASDGGRESGYRVFLYREPFDLDERANYVAESDTAGYVHFSYLSSDRYKALWVEDLNRNRIWDRERERAQPFASETFTLEHEGEYHLGTLHIERPDTTRPRLQGVGLLTENRMRLRFDDEIYWDSDAVIEVRDSLDQHYTDAWPLYLLPEDERVVMAQSERELAEEQRFQLQLAGFADRAGNPARVTTEPFAGSAQPDTVSLAIIGDNRDPGLFPDEPLIVGYNKWIDRQDILDSLRVVAGDDMIEDWPSVEVDRHRLEIHPDPVWEGGISYQFLAWNPAREELRPIEPVIWQRNQLGGIELRIQEESDSSTYRYRIFDHDDKLEREGDFVQSVEIGELPPLRYTVIVFRDPDDSGVWNSGSVKPFRAPEPYFARRNVPIREGFTSEIEVHFDLPCDEVVMPDELPDGEEGDLELSEPDIDSDRQHDPGSEADSETEEEVDLPDINN